jgi:hypothetical protein
LKKALYIIGGINLGILLLFSFSDAHSVNDYFVMMGILSFIVSLGNLILGIILLVIGLASKEAIPFGKACLLSAGVLLLCGFTLCSTFRAHIGHM